MNLHPWTAVIEDFHNNHLLFCLVIFFYFEEWLKFQWNILGNQEVWVTEKLQKDAVKA
jgi:hypothetical protein